MSNLPIRRAQFKTAAFLAWLAEQGAEVGKPTNPYEVVRYKAYTPGAMKAGTHVVYAKESGLLTFSAATKAHYETFLTGGRLVGAFVSRFDTPTTEGPAAEPKPSKSAKVRQKLLERDGPDCWFCGTVMGDDCTIEHLVPKSEGGGNRLANYALAHQRCNARAANLPLVQKIALRGEMRAHESPVGNADAPEVQS